MILPMALIIMGAAYWPVTLILALIAAALGARVQGGWRVVCFTISGVLLATLALGMPLVAGWKTSA